jgi:hypothetical protein
VITRRSLLGLSAAVLAACSGKKHRPSAAPPHPDDAAMVAAHLEEQALISAYTSALADAKPKQQAHLEVELAVHRTHLAALSGYPPRPGTAVPIVAPAGIRRALAASAGTARAAAVDATDGSNAALLASIAASHSVSAGLT